MIEIYVQHDDEGNVTGSVTVCSADVPQGDNQIIADAVPLEPSVVNDDGEIVAAPEQPVCPSPAPHP